MVYRHKMSTLVVVATAMSLLVSACGSSSSGGGGGAGSSKTAAGDVFTQYGSMTPDQRDSALYDLAKSQGTISIYYSFQDVATVAKAFEKKYPGLTTKLYRADNETVAAKIQQEANAGKPGSDVVELGATNLDDLETGGVLADNYKADSTNLQAGAVHKGWTASRYNAFFVAWNTNKVAPNEIPKSYQDLENPKWKGKLAVEVGDYTWYQGLTDYFIKQGMSAGDVKTMFEKIVSNARVTKGHTATTTLLGSGEYSIFADSYNDGIKALQAKNAPIEYKDSSGKPAVQPVFIDSSGIGIIKDGAHKAGAMLFADFFHSQAGQQIVSDAGTIPSLQGINHQLDGVQTVEAPLAEVESQKSQDAYKDLLTHALKG